MSTEDERRANFLGYLAAKRANQLQRLQVIRCPEGCLQIGAYRVNGHTLIVVPPYRRLDNGTWHKIPGETWIDEHPGPDEIEGACKHGPYYAVVTDQWRLHAWQVAPEHA